MGLQYEFGEVIPANSPEGEGILPASIRPKLTKGGIDRETGELLSFLFDWESYSLREILNFNEVHSVIRFRTESDTRRQGELFLLGLDGDMQDLVSDETRFPLPISQPTIRVYRDKRRIDWRGVNPRFFPMTGELSRVDTETPGANRGSDMVLQVLRKGSEIILNRKKLFSGLYYSQEKRRLGPAIVPFHVDILFENERFIAGIQIIEADSQEEL